VLFALGHEITPPAEDLGTAMYFAAESLLTIGYGEITANGVASRIIVTFAAITGLGVVAIVVTFLFSIYASYQRREREVIALQATAGAPPSAVRLLSMYGRLGLVDRLPDFFITWQRWAAEVLDSHVAYPLLGYFRASHDNLSWISALGTVLDAATLVTTTIRGVPRGEAELCRRVGTHLVEDISSLGFREGGATPLTREEFDLAYRRLAAAGYDLEPSDKAWRMFERARGPYAEQLQQMAAYWATPAASWLGTHSPLRSPVHHDEETADAGVEPSVEAEAH
jgi:Ion channel